MPEALAALLTEELKLDSGQNVLRVQGLLDLAHLSSLPVCRRPSAAALPPQLPSPASACHTTNARSKHGGAMLPPAQGRC